MTYWREFAWWSFETDCRPLLRPHRVIIILFQQTFRPAQVRRTLLLETIIVGSDDIGEARHRRTFSSTLRYNNIMCARVRHVLRARRPDVGLDDNIIFCQHGSEDPSLVQPLVLDGIKTSCPASDLLDCNDYNIKLYRGSRGVKHQPSNIGIPTLYHVHSLKMFVYRTWPDNRLFAHQKFRYSACIYVIYYMYKIPFY